MPDIENYLKYFAYLWPRRQTKNGLLLAWLLWAIFASSIPIPIVSEELSVGIRGLSGVLGGLAIFVLWLLTSGRWVIRNREKIVAVALRSLDSETQLVIKKTLVRVEQQFKALNIGKAVQILEIGTDIFSTREEAEEYIQKRKLQMAIHGNVYRGQRDGAYVCDLRNFFWSARVALVPGNAHMREELLADLQLMLNGRNWTVSENNDIVDLDRVAQNMAHVILSLIALSISYSREHLRTSIGIIEALLPALDKGLKPEERVIRVNQEAKVARMNIELFRSGRLRTILVRCYVLLARQLAAEKKITEAIVALETALRHGGDEVECYVGLAAAYYHQGSLAKAKDYTERINKLHPNDITYLVNKAFFSILDRDYRGMFNYYTQIPGGRDIRKLNVVSAVLEFWP